MQSPALRKLRQEKPILIIEIHNKACSISLGSDTVDEAELSLSYCYSHRSPLSFKDKKLKLFQVPAYFVIGWEGQENSIINFLAPF